MAAREHIIAEKSKKRYRRIGKRIRIWVVLACGVAVIAFIALPLRFNGYLFGEPMYEEVFAAAPRAANATPTPIPTPTPTPSAQPEPEITPEAAPAMVDEAKYPPLTLEQKDEAVSTLQQRLMELGYFDYDEITDYYGTVTQSAVLLFQRVQGLEQSGIATSLTQQILYSEEALPYRMKSGDKGVDVRGMQRRLVELGYYEDKDNGYFGVATERAVKAFQKRNNLEQNGIIDHVARDLLYSPRARYLVDPTPTPKPKPTPTIKPTAKPTQKPTKNPSPTYDIPNLDDNGQPVATPKPTAKPTPTPTQRYEEEAPGSYSSDVNGLIAAAKAQMGKPYVWSEEGPDSFDCSGLVYYALRLSGIRVSRYNAAGFSQLSSWQAVDSLADCKKGDLLFYKSDTNPNVNHTGIYLGGGQFIHASSSQGRVIISSTTGYYDRNFIIARRVF